MPIILQLLFQIHSVNIFLQMRNGLAIIGENSSKPLYTNSKIQTHAEMDALNKVNYLLKCKKIKKTKMDLIVLRVNKSGNLCESAPCFHCTKQLFENKSIKIEKLYYSTSSGNIKCVKFNK